MAKREDISLLHQVFKKRDASSFQDTVTLNQENDGSFEYKGKKYNADTIEGIAELMQERFVLIINPHLPDTRIAQKHE